MGKVDDKVIEALATLASDEQAAVATIVATRGSTPRKSGAQILFFRDGRIVGTIGGGCGEAEARRYALRAMATGDPLSVQINLTHEVAEEDGMVCGGIMEIFIQPFNSGQDHDLANGGDNGGDNGGHSDKEQA